MRPPGPASSRSLRPALSVLSVLAALSVISVALAGCIGPADDAGDVGDASTGVLPTTPIPTLVPPSFLEPVLLGTFRGTVNAGAEPSIATAPDGTVYVVTPLNLWRSTDGGSTFEWLGTPRACAGTVPECPYAGRDSGLRGGGDGDIAVGPDMRVHWAGLNAQGASVPYQVSTDLGDTWSEPFDIADGNTSDREWIHIRPSDGAVFVTWRDFGAAQDGGLLSDGPSESMVAVRASHDGGATWGPIVKAADDTRQGGAVADPRGGNLYLPRDESGAIKVARSTDDGLTWTSVDAAGVGGERGHIFPVAAVDEAGTVYLVFAAAAAAPTPLPDLLFETDRSLERPSVYLVVSRDGGSNWSEPRRLNADGTTAIFPWIAAGEAGRIVVVWYENVRGTSLQEAGEWWVTAAISVDASANEPEFAAAPVGDRPAHVGPICTSGAACQFSAGDRTLLDFFEVAIHPEGYPVIAYAADADARRATIDVYATRMMEGTLLRSRE
ncbi:MAG: sialidase family protein [Methanobacteriota archaeon]